MQGFIQTMVKNGKAVRFCKRKHWTAYHSIIEFENHLGEGEPIPRKLPLVKRNLDICRSCSKWSQVTFGEMEQVCSDYGWETYLAQTAQVGNFRWQKLQEYRTTGDGSFITDACIMRKKHLKAE